MLILLQTLYFGIEVGRARQRLGIEAPAVSGDDEFDRYFRAHQNSLEQLIIFLPAVLVSAYLGYSITCVVCGVFYLLGRAIYFRSYVKEPKKRTLGFVLSFFFERRSCYDEPRVVALNSFLTTLSNRIVL